MSSWHPPRLPPMKRSLKATMLWCARWLVGGDEFYSGRVKIEVTATDDGESVTVRSVRGLDGLAEPEPLNQPDVDADEERGDGVESRGVGAVPVSASIPVSASVPELLQAMLSQDERNILREMCGEKVAYKATAVKDKLKIENSKFWVLWSNLQHRGLVMDADGKGDGFVVGAGWVKELVRERAEAA